MAIDETLIIRMSFVAILIKLAMAKSYIVGGPNGGWDTSSNLQTWASSQKFLVGDHLVFQYQPNHNVVEVSKADYDSCQPSNPLKSYSEGNTTIPLTSAGKRYFICATLGHCSQGMKVEIDTLESAASAISPAASPSPIDSPTSSPHPFFPLVPSAIAESTTSPAESPEYFPTGLSPMFETNMDSPALSPATPSTGFPAIGSSRTQHLEDPSVASAEKINPEAFVAITFSSLMILRAF